MSGIQKRTLAGRSGLLLWCTGLTILYQLIVHVFMWQKLPQAEVVLEDSDEECVFNFEGPEVGASQSPRCQEAQLFRTWQLEAPASNSTGAQEESAQRSPLEEALRQLAITSSVDSTTTPAPTENLRSSTIVVEETEERSWGHEESKPTEEDLPLMDKIELAQKEMCEEPRHQNYDFCVQLRAKLEAKSHKQEEAQKDEAEDAQADSSADESLPLLDRIEQAQKEMCQEPRHQGYDFCIQFQAKLAAKARKQKLEADLAQASSRAKLLETFVPSEHKHAGELKEDLKQVTESLEKNLAKISHEHERWVSHFEVEAVNALREMCDAPHRRGDPKCAELLHAAVQRHHDHRVNVTKELEEHNAMLEGHATENAANHAKWEHKFEDEATEFHRKLCEDPERRHRKDCVQFLAAEHAKQIEKDRRGLREQSAMLEAHMKEIADKHSAWEVTFEERIRKVHQQLCEDPSRRHRKDCEEYLAKDAAPQQPPPQQQQVSKGLRGSAVQSSVAAKDGQGLLRVQGRGLRGAAPRGGKEMQWLSVPEALKIRQDHIGGAHLLTFEPDTLRESHWLGAVPKVACITAVPQGQANKESMREFVENFKAQTYEGASQLILIYHFQDEETAELVQLYADGLYIKGVAARGLGEFPSTADLRFGAWSAAEDAQVIAHWDFEAKHSPERLSLQVRAMASAERPASMLKGGGWRENGGQEDTIAGYRTFIWKHWYPRLDKSEASHASLGIEDGQLVLVKAAALEQPQ